MTYGHGNTRRLRFVVDQLKQYVVGRVRGSGKPIARKSAGSGVLPPPLLLAVMRGEAILTLRFITWCESLEFGLDDPSQLWTLHQQLIADRGRILDLVNRIGLYSAISTQVSLPEADAETAYRLYCGLLDDIERAEEIRLLEIATDYFFQHSFRTLFPNRRVVRPAASSVEGLRATSISRLRKQLRCPFELKESFKQTDSAVEFRLRLKLRERWHDLPTHTGNRLKPTRLGAYESLIAALKTDGLETLLAAAPVVDLT